MPIEDIICPICTEVFVTSDDIYSTNCGHLFHLVCLNDWKRRESSCPQCRHNNPTAYKLLLTFDESDEESELRRPIQLELDSSNEKITKLLVEVRKAEDNFLELQKQYTTVENTKKELDERKRQVEYSERNFFKLQEQYRETSEHAKQLQARVQRLFIENEHMSKDLRLKKLENDSLISSSGTGQGTLSDSSLCVNINILEQRIKHVSEELRKEINTSTQLKIDTMRLQMSINHLNSVETVKTEKAAPKQNNKISKSLQNNKNVAKERNARKNVVVEQNSNHHDDVEPSNHPKQNNKLSKSLQKENNAKKKVVKKNATNHHDDDEAPNSVFIKDLPSEQCTIPIENIIVNLASKMNLSISSDDLIKVNFLDGPEVGSSKAHLRAEFKSSDLRVKFLSQRSILKNDPATESIFVSAKFVDDHLLFLYATEKLRNNGFDHFFCKNGKIFAKKNRNHPKVILIHNKAQVDKLLTDNKIPTKSSYRGKLKTSNKLPSISSDAEKLQTISKIPAISSVQENLSNDKAVDEKLNLI